MDEYQVILFMAGHNKRHVAQIEEVKAIQISQRE